MVKRALLSPQFAVYLAGGVLSALVDIGLLQLLLNAGCSLVTATSTGFLAGLVVNFSFHAKYTFGKVSGGSTLARYLCVVAANYLLTLACVSAADSLLGLAVLGKLASLPLVAVNGFLLGKYWIFR
jgi:putative flippase GtrA